jgi:hypothetical protein
VGRIEKWTTQAHGMPLLTTMNLAQRPTPDSDDEFDFEFWLLSTAKEVIFEAVEAEYLLTPVAWISYPEKGIQMLQPHTVLRTPSRNTAKLWLSFAVAADVPIVPESAETAPQLNEVFYEMWYKGFEVADEDGKTVTRRVDFDSEPNSPVEVWLRGARGSWQMPEMIDQILTKVGPESLKHAQAMLALERIDRAIQQLESLLGESNRNENALQRCLTGNPIFFGPSYRRILPKHPLGAEYVTDYALEKVDGGVDVIEIESSTLKLYTQGGNPTAELVHAEQQVMDWLAWLDENAPYARAKLPGVRRACGYVVIGVRSSLTDKDRERLIWRNKVHDGKLEVLTYDDLLDRCRALRLLLATESLPRDVVAGR